MQSGDIFKSGVPSDQCSSTSMHCRPRSAKWLHVQLLSLDGSSLSPYYSILQFIFSEYFSFQLLCIVLHNSSLSTEMYHCLSSCYRQPFLTSSPRCYTSSFHYQATKWSSTEQAATHSYGQQQRSHVTHIAIAVGAANQVTTKLHVRVCHPHTTLISKCHITCIIFLCSIPLHAQFFFYVYLPRSFSI